MSTTIVLADEVHDSAADAIAAAIGKHDRVETETLSAFLRGAGATFDECSGTLGWDERQLAWKVDSGRTICNRVVQIGPETSAELGDSQGVLAPNLVFAAYAELLRRFTSVLGTPGRNSPVGHMLPLNLQWHAARSHLHGIATPTFLYGLGAEHVDVGSFREPLWKSPFDIYGWDVASHQTRSALQAFVVDKPAGVPVILYFAGQRGEAFALKPEYDFPDSLAERLKSSVAGLRNAFQAFMGEALFFVDGDVITFAGFSHYLKTASKHDRFNEVLEAGFAHIYAPPVSPSIGERT
jgi:hypothetical protein